MLPCPALVIAGDAPVRYEELPPGPPLSSKKTHRTHTSDNRVGARGLPELSKQKSFDWESRTQFFAIAETLMRRILIDYARLRHWVRRGGPQEELHFETDFTLAAGDTNFDLIELDETLDRLAEKRSKSGAHCRATLF